MATTDRAFSTPEVAISVRNPWAWLIIHGLKDIENRDWATTRRGRILIHASRGMALHEYRAVSRFLASDSRLAHLVLKLPKPGDLKFGGIIGAVTIVDCVRSHPSPWFMGKYGFVLADPEPLPFKPCRGTTFFFKPTYDSP